MSKQSNYQDYSYENTVWKIFSCVEGMDLNYTKRIFEVVHTFLERTPDIFILRADLHQLQDCRDNRAISRLQDILFKRIDRDIDSRRRNYKKAKKNKILLWGREQVSSTPHYHCALILDGQLFRSPERIIQWIKEIWANITNGTVPSIPHPYYNLNRNDMALRQRVLYRLSYLAKLKGKRAGGLRHFGSGQMKPVHSNSWNPKSMNNDIITYNSQFALGEEWLPEYQIKTTTLQSAAKAVSQILNTANPSSCVLTNSLCRNNFSVFEVHEPKKITHLLPKEKPP